MSNRRKFTVNFKQQVAEEVLAGRFTAAQIARKYNITSGTVSTWMYKYQSGYYGAVVDSVENDPAHLKARIAELERMVGKVVLENDVLKKAARLSLVSNRAGSSVISGIDLDPSPAPAEPLESPGARTTTKLKPLGKRSLKNKPSFAIASRD
jgi:transposase